MSRFSLVTDIYSLSPLDENKHVQLTLGKCKDVSFLGLAKITLHWIKLNQQCPYKIH